MAKRCALSTGNLLRGGLPRNSVDRITDRPDMTSSVYLGRKASTQTTNKQTHNYFAVNLEMEYGTALQLDTLPQTNKIIESRCEKTGLRGLQPGCKAIEDG